MVNQLRTVLWKEWIDASRDRRSVVAALAYALFGPVVLALVFSGMAREVSDETPPTLVVIGAEHAPNLVAHLQQSGLTLRQHTEARGAVPDDADAVLTIPATFADAFLSARPAQVHLLADPSELASALRADTIAESIAAYAAQVSAARLLARGLTPAVTRPIDIVRAEVSATSHRATRVAQSLLIFFLLAPFFASMGVAIDSTAGERERQSLQPLLAQPVSPWVLMAGKGLVAMAFGIIGTAITVAVGFYVLKTMPLDVLGIRLYLDAQAMAALLLVLAPFACLAVALQMTVALWAKNYKEAQTYLMLLSFAPAMLGFLLDTGSRAWGSTVPGLGQVIAMADILNTGTVHRGDAVILAVVSVALAVGLLWYGGKRIGEERILRPV